MSRKQDSTRRKTDGIPDDLLDRPIAYQVAYARVTGSITAALMLSQALYWSDRTDDPDGWFYKTADEWQRETGMTRREQENARRALRSLGIMEDERRGVPARLYFRIDVPTLKRRLMGEDERLTMQNVIGTYGRSLMDLSRAGLMRASKLGVEAEFVSYADIL